MAQTKKMEEKWQRILKECQKKPENKSCFDCMGRGNQYVVLNFNTFVCTACSGIHREMQHKIKSVGMSTFTTDEIKAVDAGGNDKAQKMWMAKYDARDGAVPAEGETEKLRAFLKRKYQEKRWYSETPGATPAVQPVSAVLGSEAPKLVVGACSSAAAIGLWRV
ncbi:arf gtpase activating protein [Chrysochromulina tobinii]|uniref:Arf gtpase activating protein n=1 Tax=Chrysochromulina tobinii TaxID=1460289 RepID=A0A0M0K2F0_9EUKA|nr:arf gtpase activating protein [Chrysochromulina tobinii]|eukprot:KOO32979.1 arf gtpase activating protein [Chrysochromulina sp. CCMP291]